AELEERVRVLERQLKHATGKLRMALDVGRLGSFERDLNTNEIAMTASTRTALGLTAVEPLNFEGLKALFHPDDVERIEQAIDYAIRTRTDFNIEHRIRKPDGSTGSILL